jgi:glutamate--cysteine ligase
MATTQRPLESLQECVTWVLSGCKPRAEFKLGTEFERLAVGPDGQPLPYDGENASIRKLFDRLIARHGWRPYLEAGRPIALLRDKASISLEPAGQFELSGAPLSTLAETQAELDQHMAEFRDVAADLGVRLAWVGCNPLQTVAEAPKMPKGRYGVMRDWMPTVGTLGLHMMHLTCTVQANVDFSDADEAAEMLRLGHLLSPVFIALFANSPWIDGRDTGYASFRAHIWTDVDRARCDVSRFCFSKSAGVDDYVQWALDVPMYFLDVAHPDGSHGYQRLPERTTFRQFFERGVDGRRPTLADWELHASTLFPDMRLKRYVEVRQADVVPPHVLMALPALVKGLFYDLDARKAALDLLRDGDQRLDRAALRELACRQALDGRAQGVDLRAWSREALVLAAQGLARLGEPSVALAPLQAMAAGDVEPLYVRIRRVLGAGGALADLTEA